jgi:glucose-1-phosphate thymidylyltransferase
MCKKGIILAGGTGSRLFPATKAISKQILPVYDKPMIFYPVSTLIKAGIRDVLIIGKKHDLQLYKLLFNDGSSLGCNIQYSEQAYPKGLSDAFIIGKDFINNERVCLILGDNIFIGKNFENLFSRAIQNNIPAIFSIHTPEPEKYGVVEFDHLKKIKSVIEKPKFFVSNFAVVGLYIFDGDVSLNAMDIKPSKRGEIEITDLINHYIKIKRCKLWELDQSDYWFDAGSPAGLLEASSTVQRIQSKHEMLLGSPEISAYSNNFISKNTLRVHYEKLKSSEYGKLIGNFL